MINVLSRKPDDDLPQELSWQELLDDGDEKGRHVAEALRLKLRDKPPSNQDEQWKQSVQELADRVRPQQLTHPILRLLEKYNIPVGEGVSFHRYMVEDSEIRKMGLNSLSWALNRKVTAYRFVDALGVRRPRADLEPVRFKNIEWQCPGVLKAVSSTGGRGTYLVLSEDEIVHVLDGKRFYSREDVGDHARTLMDRNNRRRLPNQWIVEELVLESQSPRSPARDIKFFCFYGEVLFVLEVIREGKESQYSFTRPDGSPVKPGAWNYTYFDSPGPSPESVALASRISREIPHPFMRIDMLKGEDELVFGEFTPRPGGFHMFNGEWDRRMGEAWARAKDRLERDFLMGKRFDDFVAATGIYDVSEA